MPYYISSFTHKLCFDCNVIWNGCSCPLSLKSALYIFMEAKSCMLFFLYVFLKCSLQLQTITGVYFFAEPRQRFGPLCKQVKLSPLCWMRIYSPVKPLNKRPALSPNQNSIPPRLSALWAASRDATWLPTVHTQPHSHRRNPIQSERGS